MTGEHVLRVYDPDECDGHGVPLEWERCRAAALAKLRERQVGDEVMRRWGNPDYSTQSLEVLTEHAKRFEELRAEEGRSLVPRCESCGTPMSDGTCNVRTTGWPHDLRPERLSVLCLRCWAIRCPHSAPTTEKSE